MRLYAALCLLAISCASSNGTPEEKLPPTTPTTVYVAPNGNDQAAGTRAAPFRTIAHALAIPSAQSIALVPGEYVEGELTIGRRVAIVGPEEGGAIITGHVRVAANEVVLSKVDVLRGVELSHADAVVIDNLSIKPGESDDGLAISSSSATLSDLTVTCGVETCVQITTSTVTAKTLHLSGDANAKRGLRAETSSVTVRSVDVSGTAINQILANERTRMTVVDATLTGALGSALNATKGSNLVVQRARVESSAHFGVLISLSRGIVRDSSIASPRGVGVGVTGGDVDLISTTIDPSSDGSITVSANGDRESMVRLTGGTIHHGAKSAILISAGDVTISGTKFFGDPKANVDDANAIDAAGPSSIVHVLSAIIETPAGFGVSLTNNASGTITATITRPKAGGVFIEGVAGSPVSIEGTRIERCATLSGIAVFDSTEVQISRTRVIGCAEAGVLAGQSATLTVKKSSFIDNVQYGLGAFGAATIEVSDSVASGSRWATFATCGDGSSIEDAGGNRFTGPTTTCP